MPARRSGTFIVIEGIDGSGTTTQARLLADELVRAHPDREVVETREPSNTAIARLIRRWLSPEDPGMPDKALCMAFVLDRYAHLRDVVQPALDRGAVVVCDRYKLSTLAYQTQNLPEAWVRDLCADHIDPDLYVLLDVPAAESYARVMHRGTTPDRYEQSVAFQASVAERYLWALGLDGVPGAVVEAGGLSILEVHGKVREVVYRALAL